MWMAGPCDSLSLLPASEARVALRVVFGRLLGLVSRECDGMLNERKDVGDAALGIFLGRYRKRLAQREMPKAHTTAAERQNQRFWGCSRTEARGFTTSTSRVALRGRDKGMRRSGKPEHWMGNACRRGFLGLN